MFVVCSERKCIALLMKRNSFFLFFTALLLSGPVNAKPRPSPAQVNMFPLSCAHSDRLVNSVRRNRTQDTQV